MKGEPVGGMYRELFCPQCQKQGGLFVIDSRVAPKRQAIRRRRQCEWCQFRFTTYEVLMIEPSHTDPVRAHRALVQAKELIATALAMMPAPIQTTIAEELAAREKAKASA